jgi:hypothetical protein
MQLSEFYSIPFTSEIITRDISVESAFRKVLRVLRGQWAAGKNQD